MRQSWALFALFALVAFASALSLENLHIDGIEEYLHHGVVKRQQSTGGSTPRPSSSEPPASSPGPSSEDPVSTPAPTPTPTPTPTASNDQPSSAPPSQTEGQSSNPPSEQPSSTPGNSPGSTPAPSSTPTITAPVTRTTPLGFSSVEIYTTEYTTISDGITFRSTGVTSRISFVSTGSGTVTDLPLPQSGDGNNGSNGLSDNNKKIIGGVVGGVGGAILLGGLAIVFWRLRNKKSRVAEDDDDLMAGTGSALGDKTPNANNHGTPFQSNLEQYHNPGGRPNAAANF